MRADIERRLSELRKELVAGQQLLNDLANRQQNVQRTLLRIGGAIQVLEELVETQSRALSKESGDTTGDGLAESIHAV